MPKLSPPEPNVDWSSILISPHARILILIIPRPTVPLCRTRSLVCLPLFAPSSPPRALVPSGTWVSDLSQRSDVLSTLSRMQLFIYWKSLPSFHYYNVGNHTGIGMFTCCWWKASSVWPLQTILLIISASSGQWLLLCLLCNRIPLWILSLSLPSSWQQGFWLRWSTCLFDRTLPRCLLLSIELKCSGKPSSRYPALSEADQRLFYQQVTWQYLYSTIELIKSSFAFYIFVALPIPPGDP